MSKLEDLIKEFQDLSEKTGVSKSSSFYVSIHYPKDYSPYIEVGGYDIGSWSRHQEFEMIGSAESTMEYILQEAKKEIENDEYFD